MSKRRAIADAYAQTLEVRDTCLCLHAQRAARVLARRFDDALRPLDLTHGQFSMLNALNRPDPVRFSSVTSLLSIDRTTLTAALKVFERRGLIELVVAEEDARVRLVALSPAGRRLLRRAVPVWRRAHVELERTLPGGARRARAALSALAR